MTSHVVKEIVDFEIYKHDELISGLYRNLPWINLFESQKSTYYMVIFAGKHGAEHYIDDQLIKINPLLCPIYRSRPEIEVYQSRTRIYTYIGFFSSLL